MNAQGKARFTIGVQTWASMGFMRCGLAGLVRAGLGLARLVAARQGVYFMISTGADVMKRLIFGGIATAAIATTLTVAAAIQVDQLIWWLTYVIIYM